MPTVSQAAGPSIDWDIGVRYSHFCMEIFQQLMAPPKGSLLSIKIDLHILGCLIYKMTYSLRQSIPPTQTNSNLKHSDYLSIYINGLLTVHVFDYDVTGVPWEGEVCEFDHYLKFAFSCTNELNIPGYKSTKLKTVFLDLILTVPFTLSFWLSFWRSFYKTIKYLILCNSFSK